MSSQPAQSAPVDCTTCPSYLSSAEVVSFFRKATGAPMCAKFGSVLARAGDRPSEVAQRTKVVASNCSDYGNPRPIPARAGSDTTIALGMPELRRASGTAAQVNTCLACSKRFDDSTVRGHLGFTSSMCGAKGKLLFPNRFVLEATGCEYREFGQPDRYDITEVMMLPRLAETYGQVNPTMAFKDRQANFVDPKDYVTDKDVTDEDDMAGIRAWRKLEDPEGSGNSVYLPIYRFDAFTESQQRKIPRTNDDEHPELYADHGGIVYKVAVLWRELDETPALWGRAGTGKTELYRHMAWLMQLPFERISITGSTELDDLIGKWTAVPDPNSGQTVTKFAYGRLPSAWKSPCVICLDEPNTGQPEVWQAIRPLTDNSKQLVLDQHEGEDIPRHNDCYLGFAMNPSWDPLNVGAMAIGDADGSRIMHIFVELPPEPLEREIIKARCRLDGWDVPTSQLDTIMKIARDIRALTEEGTIPMSWGIRHQIKVARASRWFNLPTAYKMAAADYLDPEQQNSLLEAVRSHVEN